MADSLSETSVFLARPACRKAVEEIEVRRYLGFDLGRIGDVLAEAVDRDAQTVVDQPLGGIDRDIERLSRHVVG